MGRLSDRRLPMLKRLGAIVAALSLRLAFSFAADTETRTFKVLVAPGEGVSSSAFSRVADLAATIGKQPYTIRSAEPLKPGEGRTVIVVDFSRTSPDNHACLLAEALNASDLIQASPPPMLIAAGDDRWKSRVNLGPGQEVGLLVGVDRATLTAECEAGQSKDRRPYLSLSDPGALATRIRDVLESAHVFNGLKGRFGSQDAPIRVFWLSEDFRQFTSWKSPGCADCTFTDSESSWRAGAPRWGTDAPRPHPPFEGIEGVADADLTFFPIVFGSRNGGHLRSPSREHVKQAEFLAESTGGFVSTLSGQPGDTLARAFERTRQGVVLTLEGPVTTDGLHPAKAQTLTIKAGGLNPAVTWQRPFAVSPQGRVKQAVGYLEPIVFPDQIGLSYDCQASDSSAGERSLGLKLPPEAVALPSGPVDVYLDYPDEKVFISNGSHLLEHRALRDPYA